MVLCCRVLLLISIHLSTVLIKSSQADVDLRVVPNDDLMSTAVIFSDIGVAYFSQLLFDVTREQLVVGARDNIYRLKIDNLQTLQKSSWPAAADRITVCLDKGQSEDDCRNFVKVLLSNGPRLFACGTNAFSPSCSWRELQNSDKVTSWLDGRAKCPYNPYANITSLMTERGVYFAGTPVDFTGTDNAITKDFSGFVRTDQFDSKWLNEPQFVGSFETDAYVFFFFRESAVEYMNCGKKIYSRVARVCKEDNGSRMLWTTFLKARLNCSLPGEYPFYFDEIQGITYLPDDGIVYATFNTPRNAIAGSAICAFNSSAIAAAFDGPYKHRETISSAWERRYTSYPKQCRSSDSRVLMESFKYQLMDYAVQPVQQVPLYHSILETIVHIAVDVIPTKLHREIHILYVSTEDNRIKKISVLPRTMETCILEIWKPLSNPTDKILSMHFLKQTESLYVGTKNQVIRIPAQHCKRHKSKPACIDSMDPYCGWNELKDRCSPPPDKNVATMYWHQNIHQCPTFDHPVPGGWSEWSSWAPCNQANTNNEGLPVDQCMCSSRQCDNPPPKNGGPYCEGVNIQVTNCTVHGEWTNWSEWSACTQTCGTAVKIRKRTCSNPAPAHGGRVCVGPDTQEIYCIGNPPCPEPSSPDLNGRWSIWSDWSDCSAKCDGGYRFRTRKCDNPPPKPGGLDCQGCNIDYEVCNDILCPEVKRLSSWTPWYTLQNGTEKRFRFSCRAAASDPSSIKIALSKEEERICQADGLCFRAGRSDADDSWSDWSPWSSCTAACDGGTQFRTRNCELRNDGCNGQSRQTRPCNTHPCRGEWTCWTDWSSCSVTCGTGIRQRTRVCLSTGNRSRESDNCDGSSISQERCEMPPCPTVGWSQWSPWSECDDQNQQYRTRKCTVANPTGNTCLGSEKETKSCDDMSNDISNALGVQSGQYSSEAPSTLTMITFCLLAFLAGLAISSGFCYYWMKTHQRTLPSSPHYISKQNPYVTVPLRETHTPKRTPSFSKNTLTSNGTTKSLSKTSSAGLSDYETATIKRNSHSLLNGHARTSALEQERFF